VSSPPRRAFTPRRWSGFANARSPSSEDVISLEILIEDPRETPDFSDLKLGLVVDTKLVSDRSPSLWQAPIIDGKSGLLIHVIDRGFVGSTGCRWLFEDVVLHEDSRGNIWRRFSFVDELEKDFIALVERSVRCSGPGAAWVMMDAQFAPSAKLHRPKSLPKFFSQYRRFGLKLNSAALVYDKKARGA
jgi:hypothetical protein